MEDSVDETHADQDKHQSFNRKSKHNKAEEMNDNTEVSICNYSNE